MRANRKSDPEIARPVMQELGSAVTRAVVSIALLSLVCNVGTLAVPLFNMQIFNRVLPTRDISLLGSLGYGLCISLTVLSSIEVLKGMAQEMLARRVARRLAAPLLQSVAMSTRPDVSAARTLADLEQIRNFLISRSCMAPFDMVWAPVMLLVLTSMHWALGAFAGASLVTMVALNIVGDLISRQSILAANESAAIALRSASDSINAAEAVIALGMMGVLSRRWSEAQIKAQRSVRRALLRARAISSVTNAFRVLMTGGMVALGLVLALNGLASSGSMVAANMILGRLLMPFGNFAACRREWLDTEGSYRRLGLALTTRRSERLAMIFPPPSGRLVVENVVYVAPGHDRATIRKVSFAIDPGEAIALVGPSSSGKSTLARLIVGVLRPDGGGVYLDGVSTFDWDRQDFARYVGFCPQRPTVLEESVADNIARLCSGDLKAVIAAAKTAGLHDIISALPEGYGTIIKPNVLSSGQRQWLAIARALYSQPKLLVFDEPSAFLDEHGEDRLVKLLGSLRSEGVAVIVITHRPKLLKAIDKVLVMHDGAATNFGTPSEVAGALSSRPAQLFRSVKDKVNSS